MCNVMRLNKQFCCIQLYEFRVLLGKQHSRKIKLNVVPGPNIIKQNTVQAPLCVNGPILFNLDVIRDLEKAKKCILVKPSEFGNLLPFIVWQRPNHSGTVKPPK